MPRKYVRKTERGSYGSGKLQEALKEVSEGASLNHTANKYGIDRRTLRRHRDGKVAAPGTISLGRFKPEFSTDFEEAMCQKIKQMESMLFGLTVLDIRHLAYELAERLGISHRFNPSLKMAGKDWLAGFLKRNPSISIRQPEAVSLSRAVGFNKPQVQKFFSCYKDLLQSSTFSASRIWNVDETGVSCVQRPTKVLAEKGKKSVGKITSAERGRNVTAICAFNAAGTFIPPMLIFPRKRLPPAMMNGAPPESLGSCSDNGWSDAEQFMKWLKHFVMHTKQSKEDAHILLLDGHHSHKTLQAVEFASEHGIHMLTLPPHCTHRMQPCDRTFFKPLKAAYNTAADSWMVSHPAQRISFFDVAGIFGKAYARAATIAVAVNGFAACGLWPYDDAIFTEAEIAPSQVTDQPDPTHQASPSPPPMSLTSPDTPSTSTSDATSTTEPETASDGSVTLQGPTSIAGTSQALSTPTEVHSISAVSNVQITSETPSTSEVDTSAQVIIEQLCTSPKATSSRKRTRKAESSQILTASPFKRSLREAEAKKKGKGKGSTKGKALVKGKGKKKKEESSSSENEEYPCLVCGEEFASSKPGEQWIACVGCGRWSHEECTPCMGIYVCQDCESGDQTD